MSNTLKFGNGEWYGKEGTILAYNSENNNYKPLPFTFDRASSATRVNKAGLIETVGADQPRVDYLNNSNGALLLEPSRTNLIQYSNSFDDSYWSKGTNGSGTMTITNDDAISPDGTQNADKVTVTGGAGNSQYLYRNQTEAVSSGATYTGSLYLKGSGTIDLILRYGGGLQGSLTKRITLSSNWERTTITLTSTGSASNAEFFLQSQSGATANDFHIYAAQLEQGSYATSIINTSGSAVTRLADSCSQTVPDGVIGQTEGTVFLDCNFDTLSDLNMFFSIRPNSSNKIEIYRDGNIIYGEISASTSFSMSKTNITVGRYKIALAYSSGSSALYINGDLIENRTTSFAFTSTLEEIYINSRSTSFIEQSNYNDVKLYNTRLSNSELIALTT